MNYLDFNSRDTYLAIRKVWSADYGAAVAAIRSAKRGIGEACRAGKFTWAAYSALRDAHKIMADLQSARNQMRALAQEQYLASRLSRGC